MIAYALSIEPPIERVGSTIGASAPVVQPRYAALR